MFALKEEIGATTLLALGIILITLGVDLIQKETYETGAVLVALGIALILVHYVFIEQRLVKKFGN